MDFRPFLRDSIEHLPVYQPGRPVEELAREIGMEKENIVKLASNENPLGASPEAKAVLRGAGDSIALYPDNSGYLLVKALSEKMDLPFGSFALAAGSNEIFYRLCDLFVQPGVEVVMGAHAFISYKISTLLAGGTPVEVPMPDMLHDLDAMLEAITPRTRLVFLPNPNNPTGTHLPSEEVNAFIERLPEDVLLCYDEAYAEYDPDPIDLVAWIRKGKSVLGTRTFSKIYGLAGLRIGYGYGDPNLLELVNRVRPPFNTGSVAQAAALAALKDEDWVARCREVNRAGLNQLREGLGRIGIRTWPSEGNFLLVQVANPVRIFEVLQMQGIIVRPLAGYGLPEHLRISVGTESENVRLLSALETVTAT